MEEKQRQLQSKYPFPGAENYQLEPQRFQQFLQARQESVHVADQHLVWLNNLTTPPAEGETRRDPSVFEIIRNLFSIIQGFFKVGVVITEQLEIQQMSVEEYTHLTTITAAEVYSWLELETGDPLQQYAEQYMVSMENLENYINSIEQRNQGSNIDLGPFSRVNFVNAIQTHINSTHPYRELLAQYAEEFTAPRNGVFVDAWVVQEMGHTMQYHGTQTDGIDEGSDPQDIEDQEATPDAGSDVDADTPVQETDTRIPEEVESGTSAQEVESGTGQT
ncbi:MAG: hypothetical protein ACOX5R_20850 [bacterium]